MPETNLDWTFFSNYAHVLVCLAEKPRARLRDVAVRVGVTERTALRLITHLDEAGILEREKEGRRNSYVINVNEHLRHPLEAHCTVREMLRLILKPAMMREVERRAALAQKGNRGS